MLSIKALLDKRRPRKGNGFKAYPYLCPNEKLIKPYDNYIVSIDSVESLIGIDLYPGLDENLEK